MTSILGRQAQENTILQVAQRPYVTDQGMSLINNLLRYDWNLPYLPSDFDTDWVVQRGRYTGKFPKRVKQYLRSYHYTINESQLSRIGNIARQNCPSDQVIYYSLTRDMTWDHGDFDDYGSCFWSGFKCSRLGMIEDGRWLAIRTHLEHQSLDKGTGRAWIRILNNKVPVVMNGYGYQTRWFGMLLASIYETGYHETRLDNSGSTPYYFNGNGYAIQDQKTFERVDIMLDCGEYCDSCNEFAELYTIDTRRNYFRACMQCINARGHYACEHCGDISEDCNTAQDGEVYCDDCAVHCPECSEYYPPGTTLHDVDRSCGCCYDTMCPDCYREHDEN